MKISLKKKFLFLQQAGKISLSVTELNANLPRAGPGIGVLLALLSAITRIIRILMRNMSEAILILKSMRVPVGHRRRVAAARV